MTAPSARAIALDLPGCGAAAIGAGAARAAGRRVASTCVWYRGARGRCCARLAAIGSAVFVADSLTWARSGHGARAGFITMVRVVVLIALASLVWVPVGVWIGPAAAPGASGAAAGAVPRRLSGQPAVSRRGVADRRPSASNPDIWLTPLMILGTQWYILFNVIAGASTIPQRTARGGAQFPHRAAGCGGARSRCPASFPITSPAPSPPRAAPGTPASSPRWRAWGDTHADGPRPGRLYRRRRPTAATIRRIVLGIAVMALFVVADQPRCSGGRYTAMPSGTCRLG